MQHVFERDVEIDRAHRRALRHFAGADHGLVERVGAGHLPRPFGDVFDVALDAADGEPAIPLRLDVELGIFAERLGFPRHHDHRHLGLQRAMDAHAALQQPDAGMHQDRLRPAGDQRVAGRHVDGERFVPAIDIGRTLPVAELLPHQSFPHRRPFRPRRRQDVIDFQLAERFEDRFATVHVVFHIDALTPSGLLGGHRIKHKGADPIKRGRP